MSIYFVEGRGWRYHFEVNKKRYAKGFYPTQREAKLAEARGKEAIQKGLPDPENEDKKQQLIQTTLQTDTEFLDLVNKRLDAVQSYNSEKHYIDTLYLSKKWELFSLAGIAALVVALFVLLHGPIVTERADPAVDP